ncbi:MAG: branched-chain amino acid ABC transporter permease [Eubacterium sp.]|nr:branched-chain amino acid ABC transporter permease [Eubacterium sp.]
MYFLQVIINGILLGGIYAVVGLGMSLILGIVKLTNLAHGEFIILGAYASTIFSTMLGIDPLLTLFISVPLLFIFGYVLQRLFINSAMKRGAEPALLVTFGISVILKDWMLYQFKPDAQHVSTEYAYNTISLAGMDVSLLNILLLLVSIVFIIGLKFLLDKTDIGRSIRATADDPVAASLSGINVPRTFAVAMGIAAATAAVAGTCVSMKWTFYPTSGGSYLLIAFVVVVIGGLGNIKGTLIAGILFGFIQVLGGANYGLLISYIFLILLLVLDPRTWLGRMIPDRGDKKNKGGARNEV